MLDSDYSDCFSCVAGMFALPLTRGREGWGLPDFRSQTHAQNGNIPKVPATRALC